ncbi:hypothetical protein Tco_0173516 [Tanacetum coccineum]
MLARTDMHNGDTVRTQLFSKREITETSEKIIREVLNKGLLRTKLIMNLKKKRFLILMELEMTLSTVDACQKLKKCGKHREVKQGLSAAKENKGKEKPNPITLLSRFWKKTVIDNKSKEKICRRLWL